MPATRRFFHDELKRLEVQALGGLDLVNASLSRALESIARRDVELASFVIADDDLIDGRYLEVHQGLLALLALQAPVAGDLRLIAALLHVIGHVERMGDQCVNMAKMVPLDGFEASEDDELLECLQEMGRFALAQVKQSKEAFERRDALMAEDLARRDDELDRRNRQIFSRALEISNDPDTREWAMHMIFVSRSLERIGDNAVDIGEQTAFVVTGLFREFADASHSVPRA